jgi:signal transduction histidine kinase
MNAYGVVIYASPRSNFFTDETLDLLEMISHQSVIAIQNARLYQDLETEKRRIVESQEQARRQLARDLHDGPTQTISSIAMRLNVTRFLLDKDVNEAKKEIEKVEELARQTTKEIRHMLFTLRPLVLEAEGLIAALNSIAEKMRDTYDQNVEIEIDPIVVDRLESQKQSTIFYIVEEALNNARKHAKAKKILVKVGYLPNNYEIARLAIIDNGSGFDVSDVMGSYEYRGSLGMINLQERANLINSMLKVDSEPGKGTRIQVFIPLSDSAQDLLDKEKAREE